MDASLTPDWWDSNNWTWQECRDYLKVLLNDNGLLPAYRDELGDLADAPFRKLPRELQNLIIKKNR